MHPTVQCVHVPVALLFGHVSVDDNKADCFCQTRLQRDYTFMNSIHEGVSEVGERACKWSIAKRSVLEPVSGVSGATELPIQNAIIFEWKRDSMGNHVGKLH